MKVQPVGHALDAYPVLLDALQETYGQEKGLTTSLSLPEAIPDGRWHATLWQASRAFVGRPEAFLEWVKTIPGHECKDRLKQAEHAIKQRLKYRDDNKA